MRAGRISSILGNQSVVELVVATGATFGTEFYLLVVALAIGRVVVIP